MGYNNFFKVFFLILLNILFLNNLLCYANDYKRKNNKGNKLLLENKLDEALQKYQEALIKRKDEPGIIYNTGEAYYNKKDYQKAIDFFTKAADLTKDTNLKADAYYNAGNSFLQNKDIDNAIESYKKTLKLRNNDEDALKNLQKALLMKKNQQQNQQQNQQNQKEKDKNQKDDKNQQKNNKNNQNKQQQEENKNEDENKKDKQNENQQNMSKDNKENRNTKNILQAIDEMEKETQKNLKKRIEYGKDKKIKKPW